MNISNIIVVPKMSKYELDMHFLKLNSKDLLEKYKKEGVNIDRIIKSHERQKEALEKLKKLLPEAKFILRDDFTKDMAEKADLIISFGGDNHFVYLTHYLNGTPILGINSDPKSSEGALTYFNVDKFEKFLEKLLNDNYKIEEWTRLKVYLNGKEIGLSTNEVFLGEIKRINMSRHIFQLNDKKEEQKCSGIIIATGTGSTGWYNSACRYLYKNGNKFSKTEKIARYLVTEPYRGKLNGYSMIDGELKEGEEIILHSLNDSGGIVTLDCIEEFPFNLGAEVKIKIGESLKIISKS